MCHVFASVPPVDIRGGCSHNGNCINNANTDVVKTGGRRLLVALSVEFGTPGYQSSLVQFSDYVLCYHMILRRDGE